MSRSISIIIPAYNEEARLPATLDRVIGYLTRTHWEFCEVLLVDDGSSDSTVTVAEEIRKRHAMLRVLRNPANRGKGYSVRHGMLEAKGEWALFSDADLSAPIEELDKLCKAAGESHASVAIGSRALDRSLIGVHQSVWRENGGRIFNLLMRAATGLPFWDTQCGFKLFETKAAREIFRRQRLERFGFDAEILFIASRLGYKIVEIPVRWDHAEGTKVSVFRDSTEMFLDLLRIRWNDWMGRYR